MFGTNITQSIIVFCPRAGLSQQTQPSPLYPLLNLPFRILIQSIYHNVIYHWYLLLPRTFFPFTIPSRASFSSSGPANFFCSSLSVPAIFFLLPLFLAQLHFLFCLSILHATSFSMPTSQMLPVVFAHSVIVSRSLHHLTLHSTQNTSLVSSVVLFPRAHRIYFFFC